MSVRGGLVVVTATALAVAGTTVVRAPAAVTGSVPRAAQVATRTWEPVQRLGWNPRGESLAVDGRNNITVVWATGSTPPSIVVLRHPAGGEWGKRRVIGRGYAPQVAADARGSVTVAWLTQRRGFTDGVAVARRPSGGPWSAPVRLSRDLRVPGYPHDGEEVFGATELDLAVSPRGAVVVAWAWGSDSRKKPWRIQAVYRPPGEPWRAPHDVTPASGAASPLVGIDARGAVVLLYGRQLFGHPQVLKARRRLPGVGWTKPAIVAAEGYGQSLAVDRDGDAVVVFTPDFTTVQAVYRPAAGRWRGARTISPPGAQVNAFALAMNGRGIAVVALALGGGQVDLVQRPPEGPWSAPVGVATLPGFALFDVLVALNGAGDTFLGWGGYALYGMYRPHGGDWNERFTISPDAGVEVLEATYAQVAPDGDVVVLWRQEERPLKVRLMTAS